MFFVVDFCFMTAEQVVVPSCLRQTLLQLHSALLGMNRMKSIVRGYVYWPGIDNEIEFWFDVAEYVNKHARCQRKNHQFLNNRQKNCGLDYADSVDGVAYLA